MNAEGCQAVSERKRHLYVTRPICVRAADRICLSCERRGGKVSRFAENVYCALPGFVVYFIVTYYAYIK